jgi:hypothetical protein
MGVQIVALQNSAYEWLLYPQKLPLGYTWSEGPFMTQNGQFR